METPPASSTPAHLRPVLYLDLDDTVIRWEAGRPGAAPGARDFVLWALERFQLRWLTTWCPDGRMERGLLGDLCTMLEIDTTLVQGVEGFTWEATESKLNGVAWLEHLVLGRPFVWVEDEYGVRERELAFLRDHGQLHHYRHCNVSRDAGSLARVHQALRREWEAGAFRWAAPRLQGLPHATRV